MEKQQNSIVPPDVWQAELDILDVVDSVCRRNNLRYSIAYGTMLGAVRHGGFIPWDDDVDIIMPREDYEKLISVWKQEKTQGYILQNKYTNWDFTQNFTKIRKDNTTFIHNDWETHVSYHTGIFVDVFPGDRVSPKNFSRKMQLFVVALNLLYARGHTSGSSGIRNIGERFLLNVPEKFKKYIYRKTDSYLKKWNSQKKNAYFFPNTMEWAYREYPYDLFDNLIDINFSGHMYMCAKDTNKILTLDYGNYMELPPEKERVLKHHPKILDTQHNLSEIIQK